MAIIEIDNVSKRFRSARGVRALLGRGGLPDLVRGRRANEVAALEGITFSVEPGESVGLIGANGSGKSTLLKIVAGVTVPTEGSVRVYGRVASLLELGAGFHPLLSGRENVYLNAGIHGMRHAQVDAIFDRIAEFSGIGKFIDFPVATYSSGMYVRLGFAIAAHTNPDIFLIDEVLAVGDEEFQRKCRAKIGELMESGKTILFVSHDLAIVNVLCRRVVLLNQGKMIARESPAKAIDFYLRQVGAQQGVHTLRSGKAEAIVCNGRISLFYDQEEVTSTLGLRSQFIRMGGARTSLDANWTMSDASETSCVARGHDAKLGITYVWELRFEGEELVWTSSHECERSLDVDAQMTMFFFSTEYTQWTYDEETGVFHDITPDQTAWTALKAPELTCQTAGLLSNDEDRYRPLSMTLSDHGPRTRGSWWNSEYLSKSRLFQVEDHFDKTEPLPAGIHPALSVRIALGAGRDALLRRMAESNARQTVVSGSLRGRFDRGNFSLSYRGIQITSSVHLYTSLLIQNLWNDSSNLHWDRMERNDETICVSGASRRFPFRMHWTIAPGPPESLKIEIDLEAMERFEAQEYQLSVLLVPGYTSWASPHESGTFPEIRAEAGEWEHLNRTYAAGSFLRASGSGLPQVTLGVNDVSHMVLTTLNSDYRQNSRVMQALAAPKHGAFVFEPGRHRYFSGTISVAGE